jgi:hypothetical protein
MHGTEESKSTQGIWSNKPNESGTVRGDIRLSLLLEKSKFPYRLV